MKHIFLYIGLLVLLTGCGEVIYKTKNVFPPKHLYTPTRPSKMMSRVKLEKLSNGEQKMVLMEVIISRNLTIKKANIKASGIREWKKRMENNSTVK